MANSALVGAAANRFQLQQMETVTEEGVDCCYAVQDKVWVTSPEGEQWEVYTVLDEDGQVGATSTASDAATACCSTSSTASSTACC